MHKIENKRQIAFEAEMQRYRDLISEYHAQWSDLQQQTSVKQLSEALADQLVSNMETLLSANSLNIELDTVVSDDECLAAIASVVSGATLLCIVYTDAEYTANTSRKIQFQFTSQLPPIEPRHLETVQAMQPNPTQILGEDKRFHVATIDEGPANLNWQYPPKLAPVDSRHMDAAQALASSEKARAKLVTTDGTFTIQVHNPEAPNE